MGNEFAWGEALKSVGASLSDYSKGKIQDAKDKALAAAILDKEDKARAEALVNDQRSALSQYLARGGDIMQSAQPAYTTPGVPPAMAASLPARTGRLELPYTTPILNLAVPAGPATVPQQTGYIRDIMTGTPTESGLYQAPKESTALSGKVIGLGALPFIKNSLKTKGITDEAEQNAVAESLIGQPYSALDDILSKSRPNRGMKDWKVIKNDLGIPVRVEGINELDNMPFQQVNAENVKITQDLANLGRGKKAINTLYSEFNALLPEQKRELSRAMAQNGVGSGDATDEAGFMQRLRGVIEVALTKPAFGGVEGEKLKAFRGVLEANIPLIARSLGHTGVLTELDVMKSFGVAPDPKGTIVENVERQRLYDNLVRSNAGVLMGRITPVQGEGADKNSIYRSLGVDDKLRVAPDKKSGGPKISIMTDPKTKKRYRIVGGKNTGEIK